MPRKPKRDALSPREKRFAEEYVIDLNGAQAAIRTGLSRRSASVIAHEMLSRPKVAAYVRELQRERGERTSVDADRVLSELAVLGFSSIDHYELVGSTIRVKPGAPIQAIRAISSVKHTIGVDGKVTVEFKLWDKPGALRTIAQHLGMLVEKHEHDVDVGARLIEVLTNAAKGEVQ